MTNRDAWLIVAGAATAVAVLAGLLLAAAINQALIASRPLSHDIDRRTP